MSEEILSLLLSNVCGAAIVLSLRRRATYHRRLPTAPAAPSAAPNERQDPDPDGRDPNELRDPQPTSHSAQAPFRSEPPGNAFTIWRGPDRGADCRIPPPASEAS